MQTYSLYLLWLPKYFDEYYNVHNQKEETPFLKKLKPFLQNNELIENPKLSIYDKKIPEKLKNHDDFLNLVNEKNSMGYWGQIEFKFKESQLEGEIIFNEFGFYYFEFMQKEEEGLDEKSLKDKKFIQSFFSEEHDYPLLSETQEDVLKETFLNDHLDHKTFNRKESHEKKVRLEEFILEACYEAKPEDVNFDSINIRNKLSKLHEYQYKIKRDEYYTFKSLNQKSTEDKFIDLLKNFNKTYNLNDDTRKKIILDYYEEQAISKFLNTVVSANYFDRITKSIKEVREGLTGKIIFMTPQETVAIDNKFKNNEVFERWSEEKIENYVQLLISKKPLFIKIDNALKSAYYISIGNVSSLGRINDDEDISQLLYYNEWKSLLGYFLETTRSLNEILHLYHSNRTYSELEEIKHYESNNHDKEDIESLIKSNENKLGISEHSKFFVMIFAIIATILVALPDAIGSISTFKDYFAQTTTEVLNKKEVWEKAFERAFCIYGGIILFLLVIFGNKVSKSIKYTIKTLGYWIISFFKKFNQTAPDDFDILEHRSSMPVKTFSSKSKNFRKVLITYQEHISTHRFVRYIEELDIIPSSHKKENPLSYHILPEIVSLENIESKDKKIYQHLKQHRTTKFSVNRVDKAKIKVTMRYRVNRIKINDFFDYYETMDSYIHYYKSCCTAHNGIDERCQKINSTEVIQQLKKDFRGIDAEISFVAIYSFTLISKTLDHNHEKQFFLYKNSFRVYFHIDKFPIDYYKNTFALRNISKETKMDLEPYDPISEMIYLVFLGRLKGFNRNIGDSKS